MKFDKADINDNRVRDYGDGWTDDFVDLPHSAGVFIFIDESEDVKYVGWSGTGGLRTKAEQAWKAGKGRGATKGGWVQCFSTAKAESLAADFIKKYSPPNN